MKDTLITLLKCLVSVIVLRLRLVHNLQGFESREEFYIISLLSSDKTLRLSLDTKNAGLGVLERV